jgi:hypothetical protein
LIDNNAYIPEGWVKGRVKNFKTFEERKLESTNARKLEAETTYKKYVEGDYKSVRDFARRDYEKSHVYLTKIWKEFIIDYKPKKGKKFIPV